MIITVDTNTDSVALEDAENFGAFSVTASGPEDRFEDTAAQIGRYDGEHLFITPDALRKLAGPLAQDEEWNGKLDGMISYADKHGWLDTDGAIQAHIDRH